MTNFTGKRYRDGKHVLNNLLGLRQVEVPAQVRVVCPVCRKHVKAMGLYQHVADVHVVSEPTL